MIWKFDDPVKFLRAVLVKLEAGAEIHRQIDYAALALISRSGVTKRCKNSQTIHIYHHRMMTVVVVDKIHPK